MLAPHLINVHIIINNHSLTFFGKYRRIGNIGGVITIAHAMNIMLIFI